MSIFFNYNNKLYNEGEAILSPDNRSFKYGDGLFETMKMVDGKIILMDYHFQRLFSGMDLLQFEIPEYFTTDFLMKKVTEVSKINQHTNSARIRLTIFRGDGNLHSHNNFPNYVIQSETLLAPTEVNKEGLSIEICEQVQKSCDSYSNLKTNNFLPYVMAALYAKKIKVDDCVILNAHNRICDTTIANIFLVKDDNIYTPSLSEGCIAGVIRRWLIEYSGSSTFKIIEKEITVDELRNADEVFLTNSIFDIKWVKQFGNKEYKNDVIKEIRKFLNDNLYKPI